MKVIEHVSELEIGKHYFLFDKRTGRYEGIHPLEWDGRTHLRDITDEDDGTFHEYVKAAKFPHSYWTHAGNNQGMRRWTIIGPVFMETGATLDSVLAMCDGTLNTIQFGLQVTK